MKFSDEDLGFRVEGEGFSDFGLRVQGLDFRI
jgi:hypothetical protein